MNIPTLAIPKIGSPVLVNRITSLAAPIGAILVSIAVLVLIVRPKFFEVLRLRVENKQLSTRAVNLEAKAQKLAGYDRDLLNTQLISAEQLLPSDKNVFSFVSQIEKSAGSTGVILNKLEVITAAVPAGAGAGVQAQPDPISTKLAVKVSTSSDYKALLQFMSNLLGVPRIVYIRDLTIAAGTSGSQIRTSFVADAFFFPLPKELPSIETPIADLTANEASWLEKVKAAGTNVEVPKVQTGRSDLFAPF